MSDYDLSVLNDKEFELLIADLLSAEYGVPVERFKPGKDGGVDARWFASPEQEVIVQCKHWPRSNVAAVIRRIRSDEQSKVAALNPARYIFVCSLPLSRANKDAIADAFMPYVVKPDDILGYEDLQGLISRHKEVERKHYKLWLASSNVLVALLNNGILGRSADSVREIRDALSKFIETDDCRKARAQLAQSRVLIIKGEPGIGKTTLAQHLIMESIGDGFQLVEIQNDLTEAEDVFDPESKQIFYFDDFLGRNFLEAIEDNKDSHIVSFIKRVLRNEHKRFVLTSRTHILDRGKQLSELFRIEKVSRREFELTVGSLSRLEKGMILYSHIWNSGLPEWAVEELYVNSRYLEIVDHRNFNPRIISFITDPERLVDLREDSFWPYVIDTLNNPEAIWRHVFERQLGEDTRDLAVLVAFNGKPIKQGQLEVAFRRLNELSSDNPVKFGMRFMEALKLGVGSVLNRVIESPGETVCALFNPSIADYLLREDVVVSRIPEVARALQTAEAVGYLASLASAGYIEEVVKTRALLMIAEDLIARNEYEGDLAVKVADFLAGAEVGSVGMQLVQSVAACYGARSIYGNAARLRVFAAALTAGLLVDGICMFEAMLGEIEVCSTDVDAMRLLGRCARWIDAEAPEIDAEERLRAALLEAWLNYAHGTVVESAVLDEYMIEEEAGAARDAVRTYVARAFESVGFPLNEHEIEDFVDRVDVVDILNDNLVAASRGWDEPEARGNSENSSAAIMDYFDRSGREG